ncbi:MULTISPECIES: Sec-independent protein translocase protein TatB [Acinetobacter]|jgi:sec-independent protein translocase protein TatB|uniref:Sec-independent protein translocase protein TatB n=1 Tax=Acinetobacter schindleri CIP 107287 TaxID=1217988 RepID=N9ABD8_9GAMM|nr:Sec-independent protein translocase protein TatB [Acinetobacter schindleri]APX62757.1 Sec-independent protein translocase protein TatB [Acinetobacter schindleri]ENV43449.1 twin arginine-targeting protein translocase TatB [Acinetobacter schindleri CIP 107287]MCK8640360.1 Sec-independent protein translocase protein TatB [Acinetobacter schindleri]MCO8068170.1 Sec-independent protein translocase protein TatB [Acinetobacter schindleri]MEB5928402.1 Sec-independent protein translocase protein TatB
MLNIGMTELLAFGVIALLVLGPDKLPEAVRFIGKWSTKIKRTVSNIQNDLDRELRLSELREQMQSELKRIQELEAKMQAQMADLNAPIEPVTKISEQPVLKTQSSYELVNQPLSPVHLTPARQVAKQEKKYPDMKVAV